MDPKVQINVEEWKSPEGTSQRKKKVEMDYLIYMIHVGNFEEEILIESEAVVDVTKNNIRKSKCNCTTL